MAFSTRSINPRRKRTKTFTGCWTCRARKVKCDETRPHCHQCRRKGLQCEGYDARLQWLPPDTGFLPNTCLSRPEPTVGGSLRRQVSISPPQTVLTWGQVEDILRLLEFESSQCEDVCFNIQNFGVFNASQTPETSFLNWIAPRTTILNDRPEIVPQDQTARPEPVHHSHSPDVLTSELSSLFSSPSFSEEAAAWELCNLHGHLSPSEVSLNDLSAAVPSSEFDSSEASAIVTISSSRSQGPNDETSSSPTCPLASLLPSQERFLMHHYMHRVVNIFCVIDNAKSPWKTIHLPRAIQGAGELSIMGTTSRIRSALRNALLSISAYYFSNVQGSHPHQDGADEWVEAATRYRYNAIGLLKKAVEADLYSPEKPKYKEYLATMLSMITINVMSGDTSTCGVHLDGAKQLISHMGQGKPRLSGKARALHRIYFYLRVIFESTAMRRNIDSGHSPTPNTLGMSQSMPSDIQQCDFIEEEDFPAPSGAMQAVSEMATYECIYGIPQSLLVLLRDTTNLINQVEDARNASGSTSIPEDLGRLCDSIEKDIFDWPLEKKLARYRRTSIGTSFQIIHHQTSSFHNALIIYFSQNIRLLSYRYLRPYVESVLGSIEAIEAIKSETKLLAAPLFWPAFIAATEAFDGHLQDRFRQWYEKVAVYGIKAVRTGSQVVYRVWERGPSSDGRNTSLWRSVIDQTGDTLMLT